MGQSLDILEGFAPMRPKEDVSCEGVPSETKPRVDTFEVIGKRSHVAFMLNSSLKYLALAHEEIGKRSHVAIMLN